MSRPGARLFDHCGLTEVGPLGIACPKNPGGLHLLESECLAEVIDPATTQPVSAGEVGELVLTNFGRLGSPAIRYRTGDLVRTGSRPCPCGRTLVRLEGGILGRTDDMIHVRGNNLYPSAIEAVIRRFPEIVEYRVRRGPIGTARGAGHRSRAAVSVSETGLAERVAQAMRDEFLFRAGVTEVAPGSLPRFEMKARRFEFSDPGDSAAGRS